MPSYGKRLLAGKIVEETRNSFDGHFFPPFFLAQLGEHIDPPLTHTHTDSFDMNYYNFARSKVKKHRPLFLPPRDVPRSRSRRGEERREENRERERTERGGASKHGPPVFTVSHRISNRLLILPQPDADPHRWSVLLATFFPPLKGLSV